MWGKVNNWFDHPYWFFASIALKGAAFILIIGVLGLLLTSVGWHSIGSWSDLYYDLLFARSNNQPNGAHLISYLPIPLLGLYVALKYKQKGDLPNSYLGLLVCALGVAIHEGVWIVAYYSRYWQYLDMTVFDNVAKDVFFIVMLALFLYTYVKYPLGKIPIKTFLWPTIIYSVFIFYWWAIGLPITTINNFKYGEGVFGVTPLWNDPFTNALEIISWVLMYLLMFLAIRRLPKNAD
jgi:hypothetical protein